MVNHRTREDLDPSLIVKFTQEFLNVTTDAIKVIDLELDTFKFVLQIEDILFFAINRELVDRDTIKLINKLQEYTKTENILNINYSCSVIGLLEVSDPNIILNIKFLENKGQIINRFQFINGFIPKYFFKQDKINAKISLKDLLKKNIDLKQLENIFLKDLIEEYNLSYSNIIPVLIVVFLFSIIGRNDNLRDSKLSLEQFFHILLTKKLFTKQINTFMKIIPYSNKRFFTDTLDLKIIDEICNNFPICPKEPTRIIEEIAITPLFLSNILEISESSEATTKKRGKFYTKLNDAEFITNLTFYRILSKGIVTLNSHELSSLIFKHDFTDVSTKFSFSQNLNIKILDPACGTGTFLITIERLYSFLNSILYQKSQSNSFKVEITCVDSDSRALLITAARWMFLSILEADNSPNITVNFIHNDYLQLTLDSPKYDLIIGNPPWVRHEDIGSNLPSEYKLDLIKWANKETDNDFDRKSDLYVYFCIKALTQLKPTGILAYLTSNAWLEVKYGHSLQKYILKSENGIKRIQILNQRGKRLWSQLGINSIILIVEKGETNRELASFFVESAVSFHEIPVHSLINGILTFEKYSDKYYRMDSISKIHLQTTHKWAGNFLRASSSERQLLQKLRIKGKFLKDLASIKFTTKTGANDFFYLELTNEQPTLKNVLEVRNKLGFQGFIETKFLKPLLKGPSEISGFFIPNNFQSKNWVLLCNEPLEQLENTYILDYLLWGENVSIKIKQGKNKGSTVKGFASLQSIKQRTNWYTLPPHPTPDLLWIKSYHTKYGCILNEGDIVPDQRFYSIKVKESRFISLIFVFLNSSYVWALMELEGNTNMGYGVLDTNIYWLKSLKIPFELIERQRELNILASQLISQKKRLSIDKESPLRKEIDLFFASYFDYSSSDLEVMYNYIKRNINARLQRTE